MKRERERERERKRERNSISKTRGRDKKAAFNFAQMLGLEHSIGHEAGRKGNMQHKTVLTNVTRSVNRGQEKRQQIHCLSHLPCRTLTKDKI